MTETSNKNLSLAVSLGAAALGMLMMAYASVPLYRLFCESTGFGGVARATATPASIPVFDRKMTVQFDANINPELVWEFTPGQREVTLKVGEKKTVEYIAKNIGNKTTQGTATFNITPVKAGKYFHKIQCFCFTDQTIKPGETEHLKVFFYIDPDIMKDPDLNDVNTITLSYTFFPLKK